MAKSGVSLLDSVSYLAYCSTSFLLTLGRLRPKEKYMKVAAIIPLLLPAFLPSLSYAENLCGIDVPPGNVGWGDTTNFNGIYRLYRESQKYSQENFGQRSRLKVCGLKESIRVIVLADYEFIGNNFATKVQGTTLPSPSSSGDGYPISAEVPGNIPGYGRGLLQEQCAGQLTSVSCQFQIGFYSHKCVAICHPN